MFIRDKRKLYRHEVESAVGKDATAKQVLDHLFGGPHDYGCHDADFVIYKWTGEKRTVLHRLNMFWAMPLTLLLSPFMYLFAGQVGWDTKTKVGRFILRVTGHLKDD